MCLQPCSNGLLYVASKAGGAAYFETPFPTFDQIIAVFFAAHDDSVTGNVWSRHENTVESLLYVKQEGKLLTVQAV